MYLNQTTTNRDQPMKSTKSILLFTAISFLLFLHTACEKDEQDNMQAPAVVTLAVTEITPTTASCGGNITADGGDPVVARGVVWSTNTSPSLEDHKGITADGTGPGIYISELTDLQPDTLYYVRAYASNSKGTSYGNQLQLITPPPGYAPEIAFEVSAAAGVAPFEVGFTDQSTNNPNSWEWDFGDGSSSTMQNPTHTYGQPGKYTVKLTAENAFGTQVLTKEKHVVVGGAGQACPDMPSFTDPRDGQTYNTIMIGDQCWMRENLNFETDSSWCYDNNNAHCAKFGRLYHWQAATTACPEGWHLPSDDEWRFMEAFVDSQYGSNHGEWDQNNVWRGLDAGEKLKAIEGWFGDGVGIDAYGFNALPTGSINHLGFSTAIHYYTGWWSSTEQDENYAWNRGLHSNYASIHRRNYYKHNAFSVRCVKTTLP